MINHEFQPKAQQGRTVNALTLLAYLTLSPCLCINNKLTYVISFEIFDVFEVGLVFLLGFSWLPFNKVEYCLRDFDAMVSLGGLCCN